MQVAACHDVTHITACWLILRTPLALSRCQLLGAAEVSDEDGAAVTTVQLWEGYWPRAMGLRVYNKPFERSTR
jgi:hypothetical protein